MNKTIFAAIAIALTLPIGVAQAEQMNDDNAMRSTTTDSATLDNDRAAGDTPQAKTGHTAKMHEDHALRVQKSDSGVTYVVGGTGNESQNMLEKHADQYSLHLVSVSGDTYVSNTHIQVMNADNETVLDTMADAPMIYADLKPGAYVVTATLGDDSETRNIEIADTGSTTVRLSFPGAEK